MVLEQRQMVSAGRERYNELAPDYLALILHAVNMAVASR